MTNQSEDNKIHVYYQTNSEGRSTAAFACVNHAELQTYRDYHAGSPLQGKGVTYDADRLLQLTELAKDIYPADITRLSPTTAAKLQVLVGLAREMNIFDFQDPVVQRAAS